MNLSSYAVYVVFFEILPCILAIDTHTLAEVYKSAMQVQSQKAEIFFFGERNIQNQKMIDNWGNAKTALPRQR